MTMHPRTVQDKYDKHDAYNMTTTLNGDYNITDHHPHRRHVSMIQTWLRIGTAPTGASLRGAGYARDYAAELCGGNGDTLMHS